MKVCCMHCNLIGECSTATLEMLTNYEGCGSFDPAPPPVVQARITARQMAGWRALKQMMKKDPPKKPITRKKRSGGSSGR